MLKMMDLHFGFIKILNACKLTCYATAMVTILMPHTFILYLQKSGGTIDLEPCLTHTSTVEPTLAPVAVERTMTTRAAASV